MVWNPSVIALLRVKQPHGDYLLPPGGERLAERRPVEPSRPVPQFIDGPQQSWNQNLALLASAMLQIQQQVAEPLFEPVDSPPSAGIFGQIGAQLAPRSGRRLCNCQAHQGEQSAVSWIPRHGAQTAVREVMVAPAGSHVNRSATISAGEVCAHWFFPKSQPLRARAGTSAPPSRCRSLRAGPAVGGNSIPVPEEIHSPERDSLARCHFRIPGNCCRNPRAARSAQPLVRLPGFNQQCRIPHVSCRTLRR